MTTDTSAAPTRRWAIVHVVGRQRIPRAVITEVPTGTKRPEVMEALAGIAAHYSEGGVPWGNHKVLPEERWPATWDGGGRQAKVWTWDSVRHNQRRIALEVPAELWSRLTLRATADGATLSAWCTRALTAALGGES